MKQKSFLSFVLFLVMLLGISLACQAVTDVAQNDYENYEEDYYDDEYEDDNEDGNQEDMQDNVPDDSSSSSETEEPMTGAFCPTVTANILTVATQFDEGSDEEYAEEQENQYMVIYQVSSDRISDPLYENVSSDLQSYQDDTDTHQHIWDYFTTLIPASERLVLQEFMIATDGESNNLAAVAQTTYDPNLWSLEVDILDSNDTLNLTYTLIHEYAHLLTLGPDQVTPSVAVFNNTDDEDVYFEEASACPVYFPGEGCSQENSYINTYFNQFWADIHEELQDINLIEDEDAYYEALDNFYYDYEDRFVTSYAATNPEEDIAEAFTFFVLSPRPAGDSMAEEKILFFYAYPELVQLRDEINSGICSLNQ